MPYIDKGARHLLRWMNPGDSGELNYAITQVLIKYIETNGLSYRTINDIMGALDGAGKEFYRRVAVPYEDAKIETNGDVYDVVGPKNI